MARNWKELDGKNWRFDVGTPLKKALESKEPSRMHVTSDNQIVMNGEVIGTGMYASFASGDAVYSLTRENNGSEIANALRLTMPDGSEVVTSEDIKTVMDFCHLRGLYLFDRSTHARVYVDCGSTGGSFYGLWEVRSSIVTQDDSVSYMPKLYTITLKYDDMKKSFSVVESCNGIDLNYMASLEKKNDEQDKKISSLQTSVNTATKKNSEQDKSLSDLTDSVQGKADGITVLDSELTTGSESKDTFANIARVIASGGLVKVKTSQAQTSGNTFVDISSGATARYRSHSDFRYAFSYKGYDYSGNQSACQKTALPSAHSIKFLGTFATSGKAEEAAAKPNVAGNKDIAYIQYVVTDNNGGGGLIIQSVSGQRCVQILLYKETLYKRTIDFTTVSRTEVSNNTGWSTLCADSLHYNVEKQTLQLFNGNFGTGSPWQIPTANDTEGGFMSAASYNTLMTQVTRVDELQTTAGNAIASVASNMLSFGDGYGLAFKFTRNNGNGFNSPIIPVVGKISGEPGLMRNADKKKLDTYPANYSTVEQLIGGKVAQEDGKGLSSNDYSTEEKQTLANLEKYGYKAVIPSWTKLTKLTKESSSADIVTAMGVRGVDGKTISDAAAVNTILNDCAVRGKYIQDNLTRAKVQVEFVGSYFVLSCISGQQYKRTDGTYSYRPILRTISLTYGANNGFGVRDVARDFPLYDVEGLAAIKAAVPNKVECFTLNPSHLPTEESGSNVSAYLSEYTEMARIAAAGGNLRVDTAYGTGGHTYVVITSYTVKYTNETSFRLEFAYNGKSYFIANDSGNVHNNITNITNTTSDRIAALEARIAALETK